MHWICPTCCQFVETSLEVCWNCGTSRDGTVDPAFRHADDFGPPEVELPRQIHLGTILKLTAASCLVFAMCGGMIGESWNPLVIALGLAGLAFISLYIVSWVLLAYARRLQRETRTSVRETEARQQAGEQ